MPVPYQTTPYQQLSFKGAHNSYQRNESLAEQLTWHPQSPSLCGCQAIEIDIARHSDPTSGKSASYFQITHDQGGNGPALSSDLAQLAAFHDANPQHDPIFLTLDIKSQDGNVAVFPAEIDAYLTNWFRPSLLRTPASIAGHAPTLLAAVQSAGWPTVQAMRGQFLICLSGTEAWKATYAGTDPAHRLCFADFDSADDAQTAEIPIDGHRVVANLNLFSDHAAKFTTLTRAYRHAGILVRGYVLDGAGLWASALAAGVNILATDEVSGQDWAAVGAEPFIPT